MPRSTAGGTDIHNTFDPADVVRGAAVDGGRVDALAECAGVRLMPAWLLLASPPFGPLLLTVLWLDGPGLAMLEPAVLEPAVLEPAVLEPAGATVTWATPAEVASTELVIPALVLASVGADATAAGSASVAGADARVGVADSGTVVDSWAIGPAADPPTLQQVRIAATPAETITARMSFPPPAAVEVRPMASPYDRWSRSASFGHLA